MKKSKFAEIGVTILGIFVTIASGKIAEMKMKEAVKEEVQKQMNETEE